MGTPPLATASGYVFDRYCLHVYTPRFVALQSVKDPDRPRRRQAETGFEDIRLSVLLVPPKSVNYHREKERGVKAATAVAACRIDLT